MAAGDVLHRAPPHTLGVTVYPTYGFIYNAAHTLARGAANAQ